MMVLIWGIHGVFPISHCGPPGEGPTEGEEMIETAAAFSRYWFAMMFGTVVSVSFAGMPRTARNHLATGIFAVTVFAVQVACLLSLGFDMTFKLYPFLCHLPIALFLVFYVKRSWLVSFACVLASFLCCQPPRWVGSFAGALAGSASANHLGYIVAVCVMYPVLARYVSKSVRHLTQRSVRSCLLFGAMPAAYFLFDFASTVYTDFLYNGSRAAVQFMPFVASAIYFVLILVYYNETQKQAFLQRERDMLDAQLRWTQNEMDAMERMQENAAAYRHDMRHHFALLQTMAAEGRTEDIQSYLQTARSDIEAITPVRYCESKTVNLVLSAFAARAKRADIRMTVEARLPDVMPPSDTELCSLLSNALENAVAACQQIEDIDEREIHLRIFPKNNKLCLDIRNRYRAEPVFELGLPVAREPGHGFGTKNMVRIIVRHGGICRFSTKDGWFIFQATT